MSDAYADRSLRVGQLISLTFGMIGRNAAVVLLLSLAYAALAIYVPGWVGTAVAGAGIAMPAYLAWVPGALGNLLPGAFVSGCIALAVTGDMAGQRPGFGAVAGQALRLLLPLLGLTILASLGVILGMVLLIVPGVLLALRWFVVVPARAVEGGGVFNAFSRSAALTKGSRGALFGFYAVLVVLLLVLSGVLILGSGGLTQYATLTAARDPLVLISQIVLNALFAAVSGTAAAVAYMELRRLKEGTLPGQLADVFA